MTPCYPRRGPRWAVLAMVAALLGPGPMLAQVPERFPKGYPKELEHRPTPIPDRIILTWSGDPARSQAVTWRTDITVEAAVAQLALAGAGPEFVSKAETINATTTLLKTDLGSAHYHTVHFENLTPATKYAYRVGDSRHWSEWIHFRTASDQPEPFTFLYFGDAQNEIKSLWSRVIREAYADASKARFIVHAGDLVDISRSDEQWGEWHRAGGWVNAMIPSAPSPGNHEYDWHDGKSRVTPHWRAQFALPEHGPAGLEETVYYFDYQGVRIISLNSNEEEAKQATWLEKVLANNPCKWTIITFHHPIYSSTGRDNAHLRQAWQPIFDKYRVDLVLQGHDHTYGRSGLRTADNASAGMNARDPRSGTVYVVSVSGPKMYSLHRQEWMRKAGQDLQLYQIINVDGDRLDYQARTATGELFDAFELRKRTNLPNEMIEKVPADPEMEKPEGSSRTPWIAGAVAVLAGLILWMIRAARRSVRPKPSPSE